MNNPSVQTLSTLFSLQINKKEYDHLKMDNKLKNNSTN